MSDDTVSLNRRDVLAMIGAGSIGTAGSAGAVNVGRTSSSDDDCTLQPPARPVWVANNVASSRNEATSGMGVCDSPDDPQRVIRGYATQTLEYHGSHWQEGTSGTPAWKHDFTLTTIAMSTYSAVECNDVVPYSGVESVDTEVSIADASCEYYDWTSLTWNGDFTNPIMELSSEEEFLEDRPGSSPPDCLCERDLGYRFIHQNSKFREPIHEVARRQSGRGGSLDASDYEAAMESVEELRGRVDDDWDELAADGLILGATLALSRAHPAGAAAVTAADVGTFLLAIWNEWHESGGDKEECDDRNKLLTHEVGGETPFTIQQLHFTAATNGSRPDAELDTSWIPLDISTDLEFLDCSDKTLDWNVTVDAPEDPEERDDETDFELFANSDRLHQRNHASVNRSEPVEATSPELSAPEANVHPSVDTNAALDGSSWPLGSNPRYELEVDDGQPIVNLQRVLDPSPSDRGTDGPYCEIWDEPTDVSGMEFSFDELEGSPREGSVGVLLQNEAGLTGFHTEHFDIEDSPDARISEPTSDTVELTETVPLDASGSDPGPGDRIESYRWHLVSPETSSHGHAEQQVATGETGSFDASEATAFEDSTLLLQLTVEDDAGAEAVDRVELTFTGDPPSWSGDAGNGDDDDTGDEGDTGDGGDDRTDCSELLPDGRPPSPGELVRYAQCRVQNGGTEDDGSWSGDGGSSDDSSWSGDVGGDDSSYSGGGDDAFSGGSEGNTDDGSDGGSDDSSWSGDSESDDGSYSGGGDDAFSGHY